MLSPLIRWDHSHDWFVTRFEVQDKIKSGERTVTIKLADEELEYLGGHVIDGTYLYFCCCIHVLWNFVKD